MEHEKSFSPQKMTENEDTNSNDSGKLNKNGCIMCTFNLKQIMYLEISLLTPSEFTIY